MEKVIYALNGTGNIRASTLAEAAIGAGATNVRVNLPDAAVKAGSAITQQRGETLPDAIVQCWVQTANPIFRRRLDTIIGEHCDSWHAWLVAESTIIENTDHPSASGERTAGFAQMAFLPLPDGMEWHEWRRIWRDGHTQIAIDTQSNFEYRQNLVVEALSDNAPPFVAIVEECFPIEALDNPFVFFDAAGDQAKFDRNLAAMMESCGRFITAGSIDVIPTSQFDFTAD